MTAIAASSSKPGLCRRSGLLPVWRPITAISSQAGQGGQSWAGESSCSPVETQRDHHLISSHLSQARAGLYSRAAPLVEAHHSHLISGSPGRPELGWRVWLLPRVDPARPPSQPAHLSQARAGLEGRAAPPPWRPSATAIPARPEPCCVWRPSTTSSSTTHHHQHHHPSAQTGETLRGCCPSLSPSPPAPFLHPSRNLAHQPDLSTHS